MSTKLKGFLRSACALIFWMGIWAFVSWKVNKTVLIPSPFQVLKRLFELLQENEFYLTVGQSLLNISAGFFVGVFVAILIAILCHVSKVADTILRPVMTVIRSTPVASFIILALVFMGKKYVPTLICFMMVCPVVFSAVSNGINLRNKDNLEMLNVFSVNPLRKMWIFHIPSILPFLGEGCSNALGLAWKAGIAAEVLCTPQNTIGIMLYESKIYLETTDVFCWTLVVIILSLVLEKLLKTVIEKSKKGESVK
ncbi:MAG: ABC transporter permease subunit [Clostridia bacterium]|nr:ABC transporter permease subunit [Clostridia bacterium]